MRLPCKNAYYDDEKKIMCHINKDVCAHQYYCNHESRFKLRSAYSICPGKNVYIPKKAHNTYKSKRSY